MTKIQNNPWLDPTATEASQQAITSIQSARNTLCHMEADLADIRPELAAFATDLKFIEKAYLQDSTAYRLTRSFTVVHLPAIIDLLHAARSLKASADQARYKALLSETATCFAASKETRAKIEGVSAERAEIATRTLQAKLPEQEGDAAPGWLSRGPRALARLGNRAVAQTQAVGASIADRAVASRDLIANQAGALLFDNASTVGASLTSRFSAARAAFESASTTAILGGIILTIVFPPAAPLALGLAALEAPDLYAKELARQQGLATKEQSRRRSERQEQAAAALSRIKGQGSVLRMETPCLLVTIDVAAGKADGTILAGRFKGAALSSLSRPEIDLLKKHAPEEETRRVLESWMSRTS